MITEWTFIASADQAILTVQVNHMIKEGWQPYGAVGIAFESGGDGDYRHYTQAMVKVDMVGVVRAAVRAMLDEPFEVSP